LYNNTEEETYIMCNQTHSLTRFAFRRSIKHHRAPSLCFNMRRRFPLQNPWT